MSSNNQSINIGNRACIPINLKQNLLETNRLTTLQYGAYMLLVMRYFLDGNLPNDDKFLSNVSGLSLSKWLKAKNSIRDLFEVEGNNWKNKDLDFLIKSGSGCRNTKNSRISWNEWSKIRDIVFDRDNYTCQYCGATDVDLECDHIVAWSSGGLDEISNLVCACVKCNRSKGNKSIHKFAPLLADSLISRVEGLSSE